MLRWLFAARLLESGIDARAGQTHVGHADLSTTVTSRHVTKRPGASAPSPLDLP